VENAQIVLDEVKLIKLQDIIILPTHIF